MKYKREQELRKILSKELIAKFEQKAKVHLSADPENEVWKEMQDMFAKLAGFIAEPKPSLVVGDYLSDEELEKCDLVYDGDLPIFVVQTEDLLSHNWSFKVFEVSSWCGDGTGQYTQPSDMELYLHGIIKWDGCSHLWFGEEEDEESVDGYLHLCGNRCWERHNSLMKWLYHTAPDRIKAFDNDNVWSDDAKTLEGWLTYEEFRTISNFSGARDKTTSETSAISKSLRKLVQGYEKRYDIPKEATK